MIEVQGLSFAYPSGKKVLSNLSFSISKGQIWGITGRSGCGKSTLCLCLSGLIPYSIKGTMDGRILIEEKEPFHLSLAERVQKVGIVFQDPDTQLFCPTVEDEVAFAPENLCFPPDQICSRVDEALEKVGMDKYRHKNPGRLSGGQKHLVALAAVLSLNPDILILDEVMAGLDAETKHKIEKLIIALKTEGKTIIIVEHYPERFSHMLDGQFVLENGQLIQ